MLTLSNLCVELHTKNAGKLQRRPKVSTYLYGAQSLREQGSTAFKPAHGNCEHGQSAVQTVVNEEPLPKHRRLSCK